MLGFNDLFRFTGKFPQIVSEKIFTDIQKEAVRNVASKSRLGAIIVPFCFLLSSLVSDFGSYHPIYFVILLVVMLVGGGLRMWTIRYLESEAEQGKTIYLDLFVAACIMMGLSWGVTVGFFLWAFGATFSFYLIMVMSAGICAGTVTNFSSWRNLTFCYLILMNFPTVAVGLCMDNTEVYAVVITFTCFIIYMLDQIYHRNQEYWYGLITNFLFEAQAEELRKANEKLASQMEEQKEYQQELQVSHQKLRDLFDHSQDAIVIHSMNGSVLEVNRTMLKMFKVNDLNSLDMFLLRELSAPGNSIKGFRELLYKATEGEEVDFEWHARKQATDEHFWVQVNMRKVSWRDEDVFFTTVRDINEQKTAEFDRDLAASSFARNEAYLQAIMEHSANPVFCKNLRGEYIFANGHFEDLTGFTFSQLQGKEDFEIFSNDNAEVLSQDDQVIKSRLQLMESQGALLFKGDEDTFCITKYPLFDQNGKIYGIGGVLTSVGNRANQTNIIKEYC